MVVKSVNLETVCGITSTIPENEYYEVAFAGKSNVGKSSLINTLLNRNGLARTSSQPGKTQTINFYNVNGGMYLVDLPGYGYARANEEIKAQWGVMIENYLHQSKMLKAVFLLIDIRHDPSENDQLMYEWMVNQGYAPIIIATKADKLGKGGIANSVQTIKRVLRVEPGTIIIPFSAETRMGKDEVWQVIERLVFPDGLPESMISRKEQEKQNAEDEARSKAERGIDGQEEEAPKKKERWKKTDRPVAKKTAKKQAAKKAAGSRKK